MGQYNPHAPYILGQEWVPIRNAHYRSDGVTERGYTFRLDHTTTPVSGAFYVRESPGNRLAATCDFISVYPAGREWLTGPVRKLNIPASAVAVNNPGSIDISAGVAALLNSEDNESITFDADTGISSQLRVNFNTNAYAEVLLGKRILDVRIRYSLSSGNVNNASAFSFEIRNTSSGSAMAFPKTTEMTSFTEPTRISTLSLTEMNPFWDSTAQARAQRTVIPWRFQELNNFRSGAVAAQQLVVSLQNNATESGVGLRFMDLEVIYCEETRVLYGGFKTYDSQISNSPTLIAEYYNIGAVAAQLFDPATLARGATLTPGDYTVTIYHRDMTYQSILQGTPTIHAVREYYQLPQQRGIQVNQTLVEDDEFSVVEQNVLTHLTLHTASTIVTGVHAYGTSYGAPVYGSQTVTQEIEDNPSAGTGVQYPQVRFYARHFGNTVVPLTLTDVATGLSTVSMSTAEFDALPEIVDGWREVTLRFATPPTFPVTGDDVDWRWQATGELVGNQWQILVADGPTGAWQPNPTAAATGPATYWAPLGSTVGLTWQSPTISGSAFDSASDAVLIFSQDPPSVTGFAVATASIPVSGVAALECATPAACIPTGIGYNRLTWSTVNFGICDTGTRSEVNTWGTAESGQVYALTQGSAANFSVNGTLNMTFTGVNVTLSQQVATSIADFDMTVDMKFPVVPLGANAPEMGVIARFLDGSNFAQVRLFAHADNTITMNIRQLLAGVETLTAFPQVPNVTATTEVRLRWRASGSQMMIKVWPVGTVEPASWQLTFTATLLSGGSVRWASFVPSTVTNPLPFTVTFDNIFVLNLTLESGSIEIQRRDALTDWQTIMLATRPGCVSHFNDFEARVGVASDYRIRMLNALDFAGAWVTGSGMIPSPGVYGAGDANSVLIFTGNAAPTSSLAYVMQWDGEPVEQFAFPEADTVALQRLFGRDFLVATRPLERGGERFARTILVNAAAVALPSLANFKSLRDLAWDDLDYVCVRDELGNRWFATVVVPAGDVRGNRTIYLARVEVTEVTDVPTPVDPT